MCGSGTWFGSESSARATRIFVRRGGVRLSVVSYIYTFCLRTYRIRVKAIKYAQRPKIIRIMYILLEKINLNFHPSA